MNFYPGDPGTHEKAFVFLSAAALKTMIIRHGSNMKTNPETQLERRLGIFPLTNIVIANMIGAGIFTTSGLLMQDLHDPFLMIALWITGGLVALCGALTYGELGAAMPKAGGEYAFLTELYHPLPGFLSGWVSFIVGFSAPIAASAIGFSEYLFRALPGMPQLISVLVLKKLFAVAVIVLFTLVHIRGIEFGARVQNVLTILKVGMIIALVIPGFLFGRGSFEHLLQGRPLTADFGTLKTMGLSLMWIMFAYSGWNASTYIGSEIKNPSKNLPLSLLAGTGVVILLYVCINLFFVYAVPPESMKGVISIGGLAAANAFGHAVDMLFSILIGFALFSSLSAFVMLGPRVYYSMARDGCFFQFVRDVHPVYRVPVKSILLQSSLAVILVLSGSFDQILTYMGFSLGLFPVLAVAGVFILRQRNVAGMYRMPGYPLVPLFYLTAAVLMLILSFLERPVESGIALLTVAAGVPLFFVFRKRAAVKASGSAGSP